MPAVALVSAAALAAASGPDPSSLPKRSLEVRVNNCLGATLELLEVVDLKGTMTPAPKTIPDGMRGTWTATQPTAFRKPTTGHAAYKYTTPDTNTTYAFNVDWDFAVMNDQSFDAQSDNPDEELQIDLSFPTSPDGKIFGSDFLCIWAYFGEMRFDMCNVRVNETACEDPQKYTRRSFRVKAKQ